MQQTLCLGVIAVALLAQGLRAGIGGRVIDATEASVTGANVQLMDAEGSSIRTATTGPDGSFTFDNVPPGGYAIEVSAPGFRTMHTTWTVPAAAGLTLRLEVAPPSFNSVTVTANRGVVETLAQIDQTAVARSRSWIEQIPMPTVGHALEGTPGIMVQQTTYGQSSPHLRGLTGYQTLLLIDGIRLNTSIFRSGPNQYLGFVDRSQVDTVEAVLGPAGATFGSDSMGGTINLLSGSPRFATDRHTEWHGDLNAGGSTADLSQGVDGRLIMSRQNLSVTLGGIERHLNDLRTGGGRDSRNSYFRYFGLNPDQIRDLMGGRLPDTAFSQNGGDGRIDLRLPHDQVLTARFLRSELNGVRQYRDLLGGPGRMQSYQDPQRLQFGYLRYEKLKLGFLDSVSADVSVNSMKDGSARQDFRVTDPITVDRNGVDSVGYGAQALTHIGPRQVVVAGAETYDEHIQSKRFIIDPAAHSLTQQRAAYPDGARYRISGIFAQDTVYLTRKLRAIGGLRFTDIRFSAESGRNIDVNGRPLGVADTARTFQDVTFHSSLSYQVTSIAALSATVSRGFRAPNLNDLGGTGLTSLGYDVSTEDARASGAQMGVDGSETSVSSGKPVPQLGPESLWNYEAGIRINTRRVYARVQAFDFELLNPITGRTLLFPVNQVPATIAGVPVTPIAPSAAQAAAGVVAVATPFSTRSVKSTINDGQSKYYGVESLLRISVNSRWTVEGNYSWMAGRDLYPNRPARRLPPQQAAAVLRYTPIRRRPWFELTSRFAGAQNRLAPGDIDDDRIGASRRRSDIATFFRGGRVAPYLLPGPDARLGTADDVFSPTGETLLAIQNRVLPLNTVINGVAVVNDAARVPLYLETASWWRFDVRAGMPLTERVSAYAGIQNLFDRNYRIHGSGVDGPGLAVFAGFRYAF